MHTLSKLLWFPNIVVQMWKQPISGKGAVHKFQLMKAVHFIKTSSAQINTKEHGPLSTARPEIAYPWKQVYGLTQGKTGMKKHERITCLHQSSSGPSPICTTQFLRGWSKLHLWSECSWFTINLCCLVDGCIFSYCFKRVEISSRLSWHRSRSL